MRYEFCTNQMCSLHRCMLFYESIEFRSQHSYDWKEQESKLYMIPERTLLFFLIFLKWNHT